MTPLVFGDFESRSRADLKKIGGRNYAEHPTTEPLCCVMLVRTEAGDEWIEWARGDAPPSLPPVFDLVAHNGVNFDRHLWARLGWPSPRRHIDTMQLAKVGGFPSAKLEWLAESLLGISKDMAGNKLTLSLSAVSRAKKTLGQYRTPITPAILERVIAYCRTDVEIMARLYDEHLADWLDCDLPGLEEAERACNDRGIAFDRELAEMLIAADECLGEQACAAAGVDAATVRSPVKFRAALHALGCFVPDATADTLEGVLPGATPAVAALIRARQATSSIAAGKLRAGLLRCSPDGRLRDNTTYMGAHTGRWSGVGMQLQNMAAGNVLDIDASIALLEAGELACVRIVDGAPVRHALEAGDVNTLTRACLRSAV